MAQELVAARVSNGVARGKFPAGYGSLLKLGNDILQPTSSGARAATGRRRRCGVDGARGRLGRLVQRLPNQPECVDRRWHR